MLFQLPDQAMNMEEDGSADDAEAAIDEAPVERDAADGAGEEREEEDAGARDDAPGDDPLVTDGIDEWADVGDGDDDVREGEPVGAVGEKWVAGVGVGEGVVDAEKPGVEGGSGAPRSKCAEMRMRRPSSC